MTGDGLNTLTYDAENRAVTAAGATYTYDGNGLRVKKVSGSTTTVYIFSGSKVIAEYVNGAAPTAPTREYIYASGALLARIDSSGTKFYHQDHLSNRLVTDSSGNTSAQLGHFPFGESWYNASSDKLLFTSYERDAESGNDYAMARYHVNRLARFSSPDPLAGSIANPQSLNRYAYTTNDPTDLVDPSGLTDCPGGHFGCPGWSPGDPGADLSGEFGRDLWGWADFWGGDAAVESRLSSGFLIRSDTVLVAGYVCEEVSGVAGEVCYNTADGSSGPYGADPSVLQAFPKAANKALKIVALSADCQKFLTAVQQKSLLALYGVSSAADLNVPTQNVYNAIGKYGAMATALAGVAASAVQSPNVNPQSGNFHTNAQANFDSFSVTFYSGYFGSSSANQAQIIIHEGSHLLFNFSDQQLAAAAGRPSVDPNQASANYQAELQKHCH